MNSILLATILLICAFVICAVFWERRLSVSQYSAAWEKISTSDVCEVLNKDLTPSDNQACLAAEQQAARKERYKCVAHNTFGPNLCTKRNGQVAVIGEEADFYKQCDTKASCFSGHWACFTPSHFESLQDQSTCGQYVMFNAAGCFSPEEDRVEDFRCKAEDKPVCTSQIVYNWPCESGEIYGHSSTSRLLNVMFNIRRETDGRILCLNPRAAQRAVIEGPESGYVDFTSMRARWRNPRSAGYPALVYILPDTTGGARGSVFCVIPNTGQRMIFFADNAGVSFEEYDDSSATSGQGMQDIPSAGTLFNVYANTQAFGLALASTNTYPASLCPRACLKAINVATFSNK